MDGWMDGWMGGWVGGLVGWLFFCVYGRLWGGDAGCSRAVFEVFFVRTFGFEIVDIVIYCT